MRVVYSADGKSAAYCGYKFRKDVKTGYYLCSTKTDTGKRERLHSFVYRTEHGLPAIPAGYHVHHLDGNKDNNDIGNLVLLSASEHEYYHAVNVSDDVKQRKRANIVKNAMPAAREWHGSDEGKDWHRQHGIEAYAGRKEISYRCDNCDKMFLTRHVYSASSKKFCCNACKAEYRRRSGADDIDRVCAECGNVFRCNKYSSVKRCDVCRDRRH